jgi:hypothetical protein
MMRASILVVAVTALLHAPSAASAQDPQTDPEIASGGIEIPLADCSAGGGHARDWAIISDTTASTGTIIEHAHVASEQPEALAICRSAALKDGGLSLRFKAPSGTSEGGGLALRMATPEDYYLVKIDARRDRASLLLVKSGTAEEIVGVDADVAADAWHTLAVQAQDDRFTVYLDGTWIFTGYDKTFSHAGRIALWADPGGITRFDRITTAPIPTPQSWR